MSLWIELRCSHMGEDMKLDPCGQSNCLSMSANDGPKGFSDHSMVAIKRNLDSLKGQGLNEGWKLKRGEWYCPPCSKHLGYK